MTDWEIAKFIVDCAVAIGTVWLALVAWRQMDENLKSRLVVEITGDPELSEQGRGNWAVIRNLGSYPAYVEAYRLVFNGARFEDVPLQVGMEDLVGRPPMAMPGGSVIIPLSDYIRRVFDDHFERPAPARPTDGEFEIAYVGPRGRTFAKISIEFYADSAGRIGMGPRGAGAGGRSAIIEQSQRRRGSRR